MDTSKGDDSGQRLQECPSDSNQAGKARVCHGCPGQALCQSGGGIDPDQKYIDVRMKAIKHKILVLSGKGGVGKSSIAALLSLALGKREKSVGLCDLDICGPSIPLILDVKDQQVVQTPYGWQPLKSRHFNIKVMSVGSLLQDHDSAKTSFLDAVHSFVNVLGLCVQGNVPKKPASIIASEYCVVWRGPRKTGMIKRFLKDTFWGRLDFLVFDTPPGTSDEHLTVVKCLKNVSPDGAVLVTTPQDIALNTIKREISFCRKMNLKIIGVISNMCGYVCPCCHVIDRCRPCLNAEDVAKKEEFDLFVNKGTQELCNQYGIEYLGRLPIDQEFVKCCEQGSSIYEKENSTLTRDFDIIADRILEKL